MFKFISPYNVGLFLKQDALPQYVIPMALNFPIDYSECCVYRAGCYALPVHSELAALSDNDLSEVDGAGIGFVMEDFAFSHGNDSSQGNVFRITGITDSDG
ncbi:hypothetical protein, partial [Oleiphilus sp. HI0066]|uniref:hypothetical protein n=1 Tax=Oleiphilus sp. HI0066 TaxID=1822242 RepID=UPI000A7A3A25